MFFPDYASIQELIHKVNEQEQEIVRLRKYLADYAVKVNVLCFRHAWFTLYFFSD